jgi:excisionase family DNA binding protein
MRAFIQDQIALFDGWTNAGSQADAVLYQNGSWHIERIADKALADGYPAVLEACQQPGYGEKHTQRVLAACLAACPEPPPAPNAAMSVLQVAESLGVSKETVYGLCADGTMPHTRVGKRITVTPAQLAEYRRMAVR